MEEPEASSPDSEWTERLCEIAEETARAYIMSRVPQREISDLNIAVEAKRQGDDTTVDVEVEVKISHLLKGLDVKRLTREAIDVAFRSVEKFLRKDPCH